MLLLSAFFIREKDPSYMERNPSLALRGIKLLFYFFLYGLICVFFFF